MITILFNWLFPENIHISIKDGPSLIWSNGNWCFAKKFQNNPSKNLVMGWEDHRLIDF
jgi:hypothetical protein